MKCPECGNEYGFWCLGDIEFKIGSNTEDILEVDTNPTVNYEAYFTCSKCNYEGDYIDFIPAEEDD